MSGPTLALGGTPKLGYVFAVYGVTDPPHHIQLGSTSWRTESGDCRVWNWRNLIEYLAGCPPKTLYTLGDGDAYYGE
jgi:hypothetical protein